MRPASLCGYEEVEHMADWALRVWAPNLSVLFCQAAAGMYALMGVEKHQTKPIQQTLYLEAVDMETLLVSFLSELLYRFEADGLSFNSIELDVQPFFLRAKLEGESGNSAQKLIKAVTFHNLKILEVNDQFETQIVFDV
jgi:SHS2 domain-containing protein